MKNKYIAMTIFIVLLTSFLWTWKTFAIAGGCGTVGHYEFGTIFSSYGDYNEQFEVQQRFMEELQQNPENYIEYGCTIGTRYIPLDLLGLVIISGIYVGVSWRINRK